jgi:hypothetical protein
MDKFNYTKIPFFDGIEEHELNAMLSCLDVRIKEYKKGEMIFSDGHFAMEKYNSNYIEKTI